MDPLFRAEMEKMISVLKDPEVQMVFKTTDDPGKHMMVLTRRRGESRDPDFRFRDPDRA